MSEDPEQRPLTGSSPSPDDPSENPPNPSGDDGDDPEVPDDLEDVAFEDAVGELEAIVEELEEGDLALEDAMDRFERGLGLVDACRAKLEQAELKVEELLEDGSTRDVEEEGGE